MSYREALERYQLAIRYGNTLEMNAALNALERAFRERK